MQPIPLNTLATDQQLLHIEPLEEEMPYDFRKPHRHDYFECFLFREGGGTHYIDFTAHPITANSVHLVFPGQVHLVARRGARGHVIVCRKEFLASLPKSLFAALQNNHQSAPCIYFDEAGIHALIATLAALEVELSSRDPLASELVASHMSLLMAACIRQGNTNKTQAPSESRYLSHYHSFCTLLDNTEIDARLPVTYYAAQLGISSKVLNESIRLASGKTCVAMIQDRLVTEAKRRLLYTDESCKEIAYALAFRDCSYFTRFFKKLEGMTPIEFKSHWEEKYQHPA